MAVSVVRISSFASSDSPALTTFFSGTPAIGNYIAVTTAEFGTTQCVCTDDATGGSNTYTSERAVTANQNRATVAYAKLERTKSDLGVTVDCGSGFIAARSIEISGVASANPVDLNGSQVTDTTSPWTLELPSQSQSDEILIAAFSFDAYSQSTHNITADSWTGSTPTSIFINDGPGISGEYGASAYLITSDTTARTVSFSANNNGGEPSPIKALSLKGEVADQITQAAFRFFNDDGSESGSTPMAAQNTNVTVEANGVFRVRLGIQATGDPAAQNFRLEFKRTTESIWRGVV